MTLIYNNNIDLSWKQLQSSFNYSGATETGILISLDHVVLQDLFTSNIFIMLLCIIVINSVPLHNRHGIKRNHLTIQLFHYVIIIIIYNTNYHFNFLFIARTKMLKTKKEEYCHHRVILNLCKNIVFKSNFIAGIYQCWSGISKLQWRIWMTSVFVSLFVAPALTISACYGVIVVTIRQKSNRVLGRRATATRQCE